jgi:hypothetical protein
MKFALPLVVLSCSLAHAAACPAGQPRVGDALVQAEKTWALALEKHDTETLGCILASEFEDAGPDGKLSDRSTTLAAVPSRRKLHEELRDLNPHVQRDFGYIRGTATATDPDGKFVAMVRFTDIYVYRDGRWQCVAGHESLMTSPPQATH